MRDTMETDCVGGCGGRVVIPLYEKGGEMRVDLPKFPTSCGTCGMVFTQGQKSTMMLLADREANRTALDYITGKLPED
jgi:hypothetical protein